LILKIKLDENLRIGKISLLASESHARKALLRVAYSEAA